jgi:hypothetical protein
MNVAAYLASNDSSRGYHAITLGGSRAPPVWWVVPVMDPR